ncbi:MAG: glycosyltransferase family 39 protein, partial [Thermodesulfobacteriota bacterium]|nr:glycosyltransferase family 39 protein [Thermodesulfobacteriota bacterium]
MAEKFYGNGIDMCLGIDLRARFRLRHCKPTGHRYGEAMKIIVGKHAKNIAAGILSLYFLLVASYLIDSPGIYYDEITFVNISLGGIHDHFVHKRIFGIPVMMMPYIGALKSYIFSPVFQIFGVSAASIRIPAILISCCTIYIGFLLCKQVLMPDNGMYPILFAAVLATDPAFIINSRLDYGPVVLMTFLKLLSLYFFYKLIRTRS